MFRISQPSNSVFIDSGSQIIWIYKIYFFIRSLKSKEKKLALTSFYYVSWEILLGNSKKLICIDQSGFYTFSHTFLTINHLQADPRINQGIFLHVIPVRILVTCLELWFYKVVRAQSNPTSTFDVEIIKISHRSVKNSWKFKSANSGMKKRYDKLFFRCLSNF